jgi:hypothetical protein
MKHVAPVNITGPHCVSDTGHMTCGRLYPDVPLCRLYVVKLETNSKGTPKKCDACVDALVALSDGVES